MSDPEGDGNRWRARPVVAAVIGVALVAMSVALSIGVAALLAHLWTPAATGGGMAARWLAILATSTAVFVAGERLSRRAVPLTVLLKMGMVFPGRAPKRFSVARRTWTTRDLSRRIDEARVWASPTNRRWPPNRSWRWRRPSAPTTARPGAMPSAYGPTPT